MSTRFAVSVHILAALAFNKDRPVPSSDLAGSVGTSAAVIRQLMMLLRDAGLVTSQLGKGGGSLLARAPETITLREVYQATESEQVFCTHRNEPGDHCIVGRHILPVLDEVIQRSEAAMFQELEQVTIADIAKNIVGCECS